MLAGSGGESESIDRSLRVREGPGSTDLTFGMAADKPVPVGSVRFQPFQFNMNGMCQLRFGRDGSGPDDTPHLLVSGQLPNDRNRFRSDRFEVFSYQTGPEDNGIWRGIPGGDAQLKRVEAGNLGSLTEPHPHSVRAVTSLAIATMHSITQMDTLITTTKVHTSPILGPDQEPPSDQAALNHATYRKLLILKRSMLGWVNKPQ